MKCWQASVQGPVVLLVGSEGLRAGRLPHHHVAVQPPSAGRLRETDRGRLLLIFVERLDRVAEPAVVLVRTLQHPLDVACTEFRLSLAAQGDVADRSGM